MPADARLRMADRAADARARIYGHELRRMLEAWDSSERDPMDLPDLVADLRRLADRMEGTQTAATGTRLGDSRRWPQRGPN